MSIYRQHFGLKLNPFNVNPDPRFLFLTRQMKEALAALTYGIQQRKGFILLTGEVGTGKTTALNKLLEWLHTGGVASAFIFNPRLGVNDFLEFMLSDLGVPFESREKGHMLMRLNQWLVERHRHNQTAVVIIDEAQNLTPELLEEVRLLTNLETSTDKLLQVVLSGQPELERKLRLPELRQLRQRITLRVRFDVLTQEQTAQYIQRRLQVAGCNGKHIFDAEALAMVHRYSQGTPRIINLICEHALISAFADQAQMVTAPVIDTVAREFELAPVHMETGERGRREAFLVAKEQI